jgi:predicted AAA+ superfamily ATPase
LYLDPLTIAETTSTLISLNEVNRYLKHGGMPGVCFLRSDEKRFSYWEQWLDTICERDLVGISKVRLSGSLARLIIEKTCELEVPTAASIATELSVDTRRITSHLKALQDLFVIREIFPSNLGIGKAIYIPFDCGLASHLKASLRRCWQSWFINELINKLRFNGNAHAKPPSYYLTSRHSMIDFVHDNGFHLFTDKAVPSRKDLMTVKALQKKITKRDKIFIHCATDAPKFDIDSQIKAIGWKDLFKVKSFS